ncbi:MAG: peptide chain release factor N(5)-glutamine methyltransferase [Alphaproteobacteria bacterium]
MSGATTIRAALDAAAQVLAAAGVAAPRREAQVLLGHALRVDREVVLGHPARPLSAVEGAALDALVGRRAAREPAAYILGEREFWSLPIRVTRDTLIPRPDSEAVVEATLAQVADRAARLTVLDLGTGSGCLLLALLSELPNATGVGVDVSPRALAVARANAGRLGLAGRARFVAGDWGRALSGRFDLIVANPPYIGAAEFAGLIPEITAYEPRIALLTGPDPLTSYRALAPEIARLLHPRGVAAVEVGADQAAAVAAIMGGHGLSEGGRRRDLAGIERCLVLRPARKIADIPKKSRIPAKKPLETGPVLAK